MLPLSKKSRESAQSFESIWQENPPADIVAYFSSVKGETPVDEVIPLLKYLVKIDVEMRRRISPDPDSTAPGIDFYAKLFPDLLVAKSLEAIHKIDETDGSFALKAGVAQGHVEQNAADVSTLLHQRRTQPHQDRLPDIPGYVVLKRIGKGGMGTVFSAIDPLGREVAVKLVLDIIATPEIIRRFEREARILASLDSELILPIYSFGIADWPKRVPYYSMRRIRGSATDDTPITLGELFGKPEDNLMNLETRLRIFRRIAHSVSLAHGQKNPILHRDLKPTNILIDENGNPWLIDWGLAKAETTEGFHKYEHELMEVEGNHVAISQQGTVIGTPLYMAPEQAKGDIAAISTRTDIFGLGGILYFMLSGNHPYQGRNKAEVLLQAANHQLTPAFAKISETLDPIVVDILRKCMAREPARRFESARAVVEAVDYWFQTQDSLRNQQEIANWQAPIRRLARYLLVGVVCLAIALSGVFAWRWNERRQQSLINTIAIADNQQRIEQELQHAFDALGKRDTANARQHLSTASQLQRSDTSQETSDRVSDAGLLAVLADTIDAVREQRILLKLDPNLSDQELRDLFSESESAITRMDRSSIDQALIASFKIDLYWEQLKFEPDKNKEAALVSLAETTDAKYILRLERPQMALGEADINELINESSRIEVSPAWLDSLMSHVSHESHLESQIFQKLDERHPQHFWVNLYRAVNLASTQGMTVEDTKRLQDEAILWSSLAYAINPKSPVATFLYAHLLDLGSEAQLSSLASSIRQNSSGTWIESFVYAKYHLASSDATTAILFLQEAVSRKEKDPFLELQLASLYLITGNPRANSILEGNLAKYAETPAFLFIRVLDSSLNLRLDEAEQATELLETRYPADPLSRAARFCTLFVKGQRVEACEVFDSLTQEIQSSLLVQPFAFVVDNIRGRHADCKRRLELIRRIDPLHYKQFSAINNMATGDLNAAMASLLEYLELRSTYISNDASVADSIGTENLKIVAIAVPLLLFAGNQLEAVSDDVFESDFREKLEAQPFGKFWGFSGEYFWALGELQKAIRIFEMSFPPQKHGNGFSISDYDQLAEEFKDRFDIDISAIEDAAGLMQFQNTFATMMTDEQSARKALELLSSIDIAGFPDISLSSNLRIKAARLACLAASGVSDSRHGVGNDLQRSNWKKLASGWISDEIEEIRDMRRRVDSLPKLLGQIEKAAALSRLSVLILHKDFEFIRDNLQSKNFSLQEREGLETTWRQILELYNDPAFR